MPAPEQKTLAEGSPAEEPLAPQDVEAAYRRLRLAMISAMLWSFVIAGLVVYFGEGRWYASLAAAGIVVLEVVSTPLWIRYFRRNRDRQIREWEAALGKLDAPPEG